MHMEDAMAALIAAHGPYLKPTAEGRIECTLNGHTFPNNASQIEAFVNGKKYKRLRERKEAEAALAKYEPFLVQSLNEPDMLFCALTNELIVKSEHAVRVHMRGKKFQKAQARFKEDRQELCEEPNMAELEALEEEDRGNSDGIWVPEEVLLEYENTVEDGDEAMDADAGAADDDSDEEQEDSKVGMLGSSGLDAEEAQPAAAQQAGKRGNRKAASSGKTAAPSKAAVNPKAANCVAAAEQKRKKKDAVTQRAGRPKKKARDN